MKYLLLILFIVQANLALGKAKDIPMAIIVGNNNSQAQACEEAWLAAKPAAGRESAGCGKESMEVYAILERAGLSKKNNIGCLKLASPKMKKKETNFLGNTDPYAAYAKSKLQKGLESHIENKELERIKNKFIVDCNKRFLKDSSAAQIGNVEIANDDVKIDEDVSQDDSFQGEVNKNSRCCRGNKICDVSDINSSCNMYEPTVQSFGENKSLMSFFSVFQLMNPFNKQKNNNKNSSSAHSQRFKSKIGTDRFCSGCYKKSYSAMGKNGDEFDKIRGELLEEVEKKVQSNNLKRKLDALKAAQRNLQALVRINP